MRARLKRNLKCNVRTNSGKYRNVFYHRGLECEIIKENSESVSFVLLSANGNEISGYVDDKALDVSDDNNPKSYKINKFKVNK